MDMHHFPRGQMEESEELSNKLKAKAAADTKSPPPMANSDADEDPINKIISNSQKSREEGELSSYDDDQEYRAISSSPQVISGIAAPMEAPQSISANKIIQDTKAGNSDTLNKFVREVPSRSTSHPKSNEKNRGAFVPFVISFSDEDSGSSDSEHSRQQKHVLNEVTNIGVDKNILKPNSQKPQQPPKKVTLSSIVVSSVTRVNSSTPPNQGGKQKVHLNPSKLQDLRQLIAIRENELKLKSANQSKSSTRENNFTKARARRAASVDNVETEKKRPRISELQSHQKLREVSRKQLTLGYEESNLNQQKGGGELRKEMALCASSRKQEGSFGSVPSTNLPIGTDSMTKINSKMANPVHTQTQNEAANSILRKEINASFDNYVAQRNEQLKLNDAYHECSLNIRDGNLRITDNNASFWNNICSGNSNMEVQALLDLEESHDKELEEAQKHRQKCEVEERKARDAYRKAQRALAEANGRCSHLYSKREIFSAQLQSFMMENSSLFCSMGTNDQFGSRLNFPNFNFELLPTSQPIHAANNDDIHQNAQNLNVSAGSDPLSEPEPEPEPMEDLLMPQKDKDKKKEKKDDVFCPDNYSTMSGDENEDEDEDGGAYHQKIESSRDTEKEEEEEEEDEEMNGQDSLLLEASLRSKLFERLQRNALTRKRGPSSDEKIGDSIKMPPPGRDNDPGHESKSYSSILRSALRHLKIPDPTTSLTEAENEDDKRLAEEARSLMELSMGGSYSCNLGIDPLWPLCMYELRGKCNNEECPLQHINNYSSNDPSPQASSETKSINCCPPTYMVDLDVLQADKVILTRGGGWCWNKCFSASLVLSNLLPLHTDLFNPNEQPFSSCWNTQLSSFSARNRTLKQADQHLSANEQALELAILSLSKEPNKHKGRLEALKVLAQAVEADPRSPLLWIVYLQIYYSNQKSIGKDDMFRYSVQHIENCYELWLMYINSRTCVEDRVAAYDEALSALGRSNGSNSQCLLDISLQRLNCLCMSGNAIRAVEIIYGLFDSASKNQLTIYDKCVFWVCCIYVVIYNKLPDAIVVEFEYNKDLSAVEIEWPDDVNIQLTYEKKQQIKSLLEIAADSLAAESSLENKETLKAVHLFCVNHVKCVAVVEGFECSRNLLEKYTKLYPSCLQLALMLARSQNEDFSGFEKALTNWPAEDVLGIHCLYNQYAETALQSGKFDLAKELMERWFKSLWNESIISSSGSDDDAVFGLLNFSLHNMLHNDNTNAQLALDRALKAATTTENYTHCVREHALFALANTSSRFGNALKILSGYLVDARAWNFEPPLSRDYIGSIQKPRIQNLVSKLLNPCCSDFTLVNSVLETWYGPSLLPHSYDKLSDIVEFVEAVMGILPSNYPLAISACKLIIQSSKTDKVPPNVSFWGSTLIVNALFQAVPIAPEFAWLEASNILHNLKAESDESFHKKALSIYPFSLKLWKSYLSLSSDATSITRIQEAATEKGINLD